MIQADSKTGVARPKFKVIRNPALLPARRISQKQMQEHIEQIEGRKTGRKSEIMLPEEPVGYIKCRKHDFL